MLQAESLVDGPRGLEQAPRPVQRRAVRRLARRQQRHVLLQRRDERPQPTIDTGKLRWSSRPDRLRAGRHPALGRRRRPRSAWRTSSPRPTPTAEVDGVLSPYDGLSLGIIAALKGTGYGSGGKPLPVVTGQDAEVAVGQVDPRRRAVLHVFKDTRELAKVTVDMVDADR